MDFRKNKVLLPVLLIALTVALGLAVASVTLNKSSQQSRSDKQYSNDQSGSSSTDQTGHGRNADNKSTSSAGQLSITPAQGVYEPQQEVTYEVRVNTGGEKVNAVQLDLGYPADKMQFLSVDDSGSAFSIKASTSGGDGKVSIARGNIQDVSGNVLVAKVKFKMLKNGDADITFLDSSAVVRSSDSTNVLGKTSGAQASIE